MRPRTIRRLVWLVFLGGIAGMIVGSIADRNGLAITFGLVTAAAAVGLILVTAVAGPDAFGKAAHQTPSVSAAPTPSGDSATDEETAARLEAQITGLVAAGADESVVRALVRQSISFGRRSG
jgi:hypothetical protein